MRAIDYLSELRARRDRALTMEQVTKCYPGGVRALDDVTLEFSTGLCALVGADGAGKSTLLRMVSTCDVPDRGHIRFGPIDAAVQPARLREIVATLPKAVGVAGSMSVRVALALHARHIAHSGVRPGEAGVDALLRLVGLWDLRNGGIDDLSIAMRYRLRLAMALLRAPSRLLLDEPTAGLDAAEATAFLEVLRELATHRLIIIATPDAWLLRDLSMHVALMHRGRVLRDGSVDRLVDDLYGRVWETSVPMANV